MATTSSRSCRLRAATALICAVAALGASFLFAPVSQAGTLESVTAPVEDVVGAVGQTVSPAPEVATTVTAPVQEAVESVVPPGAKVTPPVATPPVIHPSATPPRTSTPAASGTHSVETPVETVVHAANEVVTSAAAAVRSAPAVTEPSPIVDPGGADASPPGAGAADQSNSAAASTAASTDQPSPSRRTTFVPAPTETGATGAPQPRSVAFVWPAVALLGPRLADLAAEWGQAAAGLAAGVPTSTGSSTAAQGVAGVHASGGGSESSDSSSLFSRIPSAVGHQFYSVSTPALLYLALLTLVVIAVALAVRREILVGRRR